MLASPFHRMKPGRNPPDLVNQPLRIHRPLRNAASTRLFAVERATTPGTCLNLAPDPDLALTGKIKIKSTSKSKMRQSVLSRL
jgi:hypothetical protein